jgi:hypothetical protein
MTRDGAKGETARPVELYIGGVRVGCARFEGASKPDWTQAHTRLADESAAQLGAPISMMLREGAAPEGWMIIPRGYARPRPAQPEPLRPLEVGDWPFARGLHGLYAGRFCGMAVREDPQAWDAHMRALKNPMALWDEGRLLMWLDAQGGALRELYAAPDALSRIAGALSAVGARAAPAPLLGVAAQWWDQRLKLRLNRPFYIPGVRIEKTRQLVDALEGAVYWDN